QTKLNATRSSALFVSRSSNRPITRLTTGNPNGVFNKHIQPLVSRQPGTRRDQPTHDDVLLETPEVIDSTRNAGLREHLRRLLERARRDERIAAERCLRDSEEQRLSHSRLATPRDHLLVLTLELTLINVLINQERRVTDLLDPDTSEHAPNDRLDVLV